jgi:putative transposase
MPRPMASIRADIGRTHRKTLDGDRNYGGGCYLSDATMHTARCAPYQYGRSTERPKPNGPPCNHNHPSERKNTMPPRPPRHRKQIRLQGWDYRRPAYYYVTACTLERQWILADVVNNRMILTPLGEIADAFWREIPTHFPHVTLDEYVIMPNHVHGILRFVKWPARNRGTCDNAPGTPGTAVQLNGPGSHATILDGADGKPVRVFGQYHSSISPKAGSLGIVVGSWKGAVKTWARANGHPGFDWQYRFHDHIVRSLRELHRIRWYIRHNPHVLIEKLAGLFEWPHRPNGMHNKT